MTPLFVISLHLLATQRVLPPQVFGVAAMSVPADNVSTWFIPARLEMVRWTLARVAQ
ncbi:MAG: hypothetical protein JOZ23_19140 [Mycobacterium sp.]|nr:hypothetical protein [Mycobacterium sp.]MBV9353619.1 hypothetical protein [Mycobacterium sp.]